jgi:hypothetical protein
MRPGRALFKQVLGNMSFPNFGRDAGDPESASQTTTVTNQDAVSTVQDTFLYQPIEELSVEPAHAANRHCQQVDVRSTSARAIAHFQPYRTAIPIPVSALLLANNRPEERSLCRPCRQPRKDSLKVLSLIIMPLACFGLISGLMPSLVEPTLIENPQTARDASFDMLIDRIVTIESRGNANAKNRHSTAEGTGQFVDETWLELIRAHRPELFTGRTDKEVLNLRRSPRLSREMTRRFIERNVTALAKHGLPITPGTLYLAHFAGPAGAIAVLMSPGDADAATVIASADSRAEITRSKILNGNPFLRGFTVDDLKTWANVKTEGLAAR